MAGERRRIATSAGDEPEYVQIESTATIAPEPDQREKMLEDWLSELEAESGIDIRVYREADQRYGRETFLFAFTPSDYNMTQLLARVKDEYGEGKFRCKGYTQKPHRMVFNQGFAVEVSPREVREQQERQQRDAGGMGNAQVNALTPIMIEMLAMLKEIKQAPIAAAPVAAPVDAADIMMKTMQMAVAMMGSFQPQKSAGDPFDMFMKAATFLKDIKGDSDASGAEVTENNILLEAIKQFGPVLGSALTKAGETAPIAATQPQARPVLNAPVRTQAPPVQTAVGGVEDVNILMREALKNNLPFLLGQASRGGDPALYADVILDQVPEMMLGRFAEFVLRPAAVDELIQLDGRVAQFRPWFIHLVDSLREVLTESTGDGELAPIDENGSENALELRDQTANADNLTTE